jgi:Ankyrin repeats (many copies)
VSAEPPPADELDDDVPDDLADESGLTLLDYALLHGDADAFEYLFQDGGTDPNRRDASGHTLLGSAVARGSAEIVAFLLSQPGIDVNAPSRGAAPLLLAAVSDDLPLAVELLAAADVERDPALGGRRASDYARGVGVVAPVGLTPLGARHGVDTDALLADLHAHDYVDSEGAITERLRAVNEANDLELAPAHDPQRLAIFHQLRFLADGDPKLAALLAE